MKGIRFFSVIYFIFLGLFSNTVSFAQTGHWESLGDLQLLEVQVLFADSTTSTLYAGGLIKKGQTASDTSEIALFRWDGQTWDTVANIRGLFLTDLTKFEDQIYFAGRFYSVSGVQVRNIASIDSFGNVGTLNGGASQTIYDLEALDTTLVAVGHSGYAGGSSYRGIAGWNGANWHEIFTVDPSLLSFTGPVTNLHIFQGQPSIVTVVPGGCELYYLLGDSAWVSVNRFGGWTCGENRLINFQNLLYFGSQRISGFDGIGFNDANGGVDGTIQDMFVFEDELIVAGWFNKAGNLDVSNIARWSGSDWCRIGGSFNNSIKAIAGSDGQLVIGGSFTEIDSQSVSSVVAWTDGAFENVCSDVALGIADGSPTQEKSPFSIFPNPTKDRIMIQTGSLKPFKYRVISLALGKVVQTGTTSSGQEIGLGHYPSGHYLISIQTGNDSAFKVILKR